MYLNFYNLKKEPFHITPDPEFLFLCESNRQAIGSIIWGVSQKKGFIAILGDVGAGKTTILRSYLETVDRQWLKVIYLFNAMRY
jgi:general secretion pathway protein A